MRAIEPRTTGHVTNPEDGVRSYYEVFGPEDARQTILFLPTWSLVHSRIWKMQVPYFSRRGFRVVTFDGRGNGKSDRPESSYTTSAVARDTQAVFDELGIERAAMVSLSAGGRWGIQFAAEHPERVTHLILIAPAVNLSGGARHDLSTFLDEPPDREGWNKYNAVHWREDFDDFVWWFAGTIFTEPHSTKPIEDVVDWANGTTAEILITTIVESATPGMADFAAAISCPTLIIHGTEDQIVPLANSRAIHETVHGSELVIIEGGGHGSQSRDPIKVNLTIHEFLDRDHSQLNREEVAHARA